MAKRRANGEGNIRKRSDGRWEGRYTAGRDPKTGKAIHKNVLAKTQKECKEKLKRAMDLAIDQKLIATDPTDGGALPKLEHREMKTFSVEQLASFLHETKESGVFELYYIELKAFCDRINRSDEDVFLIMAHKAVLSFYMLLAQGHIDKQVAEKVIITNLRWLTRY